MKEPAHPVLAQGKVRHVGDQVALVVAETLLQAKDAAELVVVDYDELPAVIDLSAADSIGTSVHDDVPDNVCYDWGHGATRRRSRPRSRRRRTSPSSRSSTTG
jgi:carbon-monoxide dehydrogenase large subunit